MIRNETKGTKLVLIQIGSATHQVIASHPAFLYADVLLASKALCVLKVYRSVALPADDKWMKPVTDLLDTHLAKIVTQEIVDDESMMFGKAEHSIYELEVM